MHEATRERASNNTWYLEYDHNISVVNIYCVKSSAEQALLVVPRFFPWSACLFVFDVISIFHFIAVRVGRACNTTGSTGVIKHHRVSRASYIVHKKKKKKSTYFVYFAL